MEQVLLDTDCLIDIERGRAKLPRAQVLISWITLYEFIRGRSDYAEVKTGSREHSQSFTRRTRSW